MLARPLARGLAAAPLLALAAAAHAQDTPRPSSRPEPVREAVRTVESEARALLQRALTGQQALARFESSPPLDLEVERELQRLLERLARATADAGLDAEDEEAQLRRLRNDARDVLATEGYFAAELSVAAVSGDAARYVVRVTPGPRTQVRRVEIAFSGAILGQPDRIEALRAAWKLPAGSPFRDPLWIEAKAALLSAVQGQDFPAARLTDSHAEVTLDDASAVLSVQVDSGPAFTLGEIEVRGLRRYDRRLIDRYWTEPVGAPYDAAKLLDFQRRLQAADQFATATVDVRLDAVRPERAPILVEVVEAQTRRLNLAAGYSTNTGMRAEGTWRQARVLDYPYTLFAGFGVDGTRAIGFADLLLPPKPDGAIDSVGSLAERTDVEGVRTRRWAVGAKRDREWAAGSLGFVTQLAINYQHESREYLSRSALERQSNDVIAATYSWTRRAVDSVTDPRRGQVVSLSGTVGLRAFGVGDVLGQTFVRAAGRVVQYVPLSPADQLILRAEAGHVFTDNPQFVPNEFLFRTGGATTVRGYAYQSLGRKDGSVTLGSQSLLVLSAEYVRWLSPQWGAAAFVDAGDASDRLWDQQLAVGAGLGARWKTVAGPIALDLAYAERERRWRLHFSVAVAF